MIYTSIIKTKLDTEKSKVIDLFNKYIGKQIKNANGNTVTIKNISSDAYITTTANITYSIESFRNKFTINNTKLLNSIDKLLCLDRIQNSLGAYNMLTTSDTKGKDNTYYHLLTEALDKSDFKSYELLANKYLSLYRDTVVSKIGSVDVAILKQAQTNFSIKVLSLIIENIENGISGISRPNPKLAKDYYLSMYLLASTSDLKNNQVFADKFKYLINHGISSNINAYIENSYALSNYLYNIAKYRCAVLILRAIVKQSVNVKGDINRSILKMVYFMLGTAHLEGKGARKNKDKSLEFLRKAPNILHIKNVIKTDDGSLLAIDKNGYSYGSDVIGGLINDMAPNGIGLAC